MRTRVLTDFRHLANASCPGNDLEVSTIEAAGYGLRQILRMLYRSPRHDYVVLNNGSNRLIFALALVKWMCPALKVKIVAVDMLLRTPRNAADVVMAWVVKWLLKKVDLIVLYYRDTVGLQRLYSIPERRFRYIPFKVNQVEYVLSRTPSDDGYVFCGGKTRRDFATLFGAVKDLPWPVRVATTSNEDIAEHGSYLQLDDVPANVDISILDGGHQQFIDMMARARLVVQPIIPDICAAGIGVNLIAMALGKCLVVTAGPGVGDTIPDGAAVLVPPGDPVALRHAIETVYCDTDFRRATAAKGRAYARSLGGEAELMRSIANVLLEDKYDEPIAGQHRDRASHG